MWLLNSYNIYLVKTGQKPLLGKFILRIVRQMLQKYGVQLVAAATGPSSSTLNPYKLIGRDFPSENKSKTRRAFCLPVH